MYKKLRIACTILSTTFLVALVPAGTFWDFTGFFVCGLGAALFFLLMLLCKQNQEREEEKTEKIEKIDANKNSEATTDNIQEESVEESVEENMKESPEVSDKKTQESEKSE